MPEHAAHRETGTTGKLLSDLLRKARLVDSAWDYRQGANPLLQSRLMDRIDAVLPMPDAPAMMALLDHLAA